MARTPSAMRMYMPIWKALKEHKTVTITAPEKYHKRIIKAVIKEKWLDRSFKSREGWRTMWLRYHIHKNDITFTLYYRMTDIVTKDL